MIEECRLQADQYANGKFDYPQVRESFLTGWEASHKYHEEQINILKEENKKLKAYLAKFNISVTD